MNSQDSKVDREFGTKVTALDLQTGDSDSVVICDDYVVTCDGTCHVHHVQAYANGTHILTIKGRTG